MTGQVSNARMRQSSTAGPGRANVDLRTTDAAPAPTEREGHRPQATNGHSGIALAASRADDAAVSKDRLRGSQPHPASDGGETTAMIFPPKTASSTAPSSQPSPQGARAAKHGTATSGRTPHAKDDHGHDGIGTHLSHAVIDDEAPVHSRGDFHQSTDRRFIDPLVCQIVELWRQRQDMVRAQQKLTLQIKAICRRFCAGDKTEADKLYRSMHNGMAHPLAEACSVATMPLRLASQPVEEARKALEKQLAKLGKQLPIAHVCDDIKGVSTMTLASMVGECGALGEYRTVSALWKRCGLAVIDGERQRRKAGDAALLHGYAPSRHAVFWNVSAALLKAQGKDENAGPYRLIYDARKAYERPRVDSDGHAHNRASRYMLKRLMRTLWQEWRKSA